MKIQLQLKYCVNSIGRDAFRGNQLNEVTIPNSVTSISRGAFENNPNLATVKVLVIDPPILIEYKEETRNK